MVSERPGRCTGSGSKPSEPPRSRRAETVQHALLSRCLVCGGEHAMPMHAAAPSLHAFNWLRQQLVVVQIMPLFGLIKYFAPVARWP